MEKPGEKKNNNKEKSKTKTREKLQRVYNQTQQRPVSKLPIRKIDGKLVYFFIFYFLLGQKISTYM